MNKVVSLMGLVSLCVACSVDTTRLAPGGSGEEGSGSPKAGSGPAFNGGAGAGGIPMAGTGGMNAGGMNVGGMNVGGGGIGAGGTAAALDVPNQVDVCKSTAEIVCNKVYAPGCDSPEQLAGLKKFWGETAASCIAYNVAQCSAVSCSLSELYTPANNKKCLDESTALTCADLMEGNTFPKSCSRTCDPSL